LVLFFVPFVGFCFLTKGNEENKEFGELSTPLLDPHLLFF